MADQTRPDFRELCIPQGERVNLPDLSRGSFVHLECCKRLAVKDNSDGNIYEYYTTEQVDEIAEHLEDNILNADKNASEAKTTANEAKTAANEAKAAANGKAPNSHASTATTYGVGNSSEYGHLKLSDSVTTTSGVAGGIAATPTAVKAAYDLANSSLKVYGGTYSGGSARTINLGFTPKAVIINAIYTTSVVERHREAAIVTPSIQHTNPSTGEVLVYIVTNGFYVSNTFTHSTAIYTYLAWY